MTFVRARVFVYVCTQWINSLHLLMLTIINTCVNRLHTAKWQMFALLLLSANYEFIYVLSIDNIPICHKTSVNRHMLRLDNASWLTLRLSLTSPLVLFLFSVSHRWQFDVNFDGYIDRYTVWFGFDSHSRRKQYNYTVHHFPITRLW